MTTSDPPGLDDLAWRGAVDRALVPLHRIAAHELRAPLNAMRLNLGLVRRTLAGGSAERWLAVVEEESQRLESLLTTYLKLTSWAEPGAVSESEDLGALSNATEPLFRALASKRRVELAFESSPVSGAWPMGTGRALVATITLGLSVVREGGGLGVVVERRDMGCAELCLKTSDMPEVAAVEALWRPLGAEIQIGTRGESNAMVVQFGTAK